MLTIEDIRNPKRKSGFDHVNSAQGGGHSRPHPFWRAAAGWDGSNAKWRGPSRKDPAVAAQDYCDYINGQQAAAPATLKTAGHAYSSDKSERDPEEEAALGVLRDFRAQREGRQGYVYCIGEVKLPAGGVEFVKIGYSVNPRKRVAELQTGNPRSLRLMCMKKGTAADERALHAKYIADNVLQEWFRASSALLLEFDLGPDGTLRPHLGSRRQRQIDAALTKAGV